MKRIPMEWTALLSVLAAFAFFACWAITFFFDAVHPQFAFGRASQPAAQMSVAHGEFILCSDFENREAVNRLTPSVQVEPALSGDSGWTIPGFSYRRTTFVGGVLVWSLSLSLLVPCFVMGFFAGYFIWRVRAFKRSSDQVAPLNKMAQSHA